MPYTYILIPGGGIAVVTDEELSRLCARRGNSGEKLSSYERNPMKGELGDEPRPAARSGFIVFCVLHDTKTGYKCWDWSSGEYPTRHAAEWDWAEGNSSCDCNRLHHMYPASEEYFDCGEGRVVILGNEFYVFEIWGEE